LCITKPCLNYLRKIRQNQFYKQYLVSITNFISFHRGKDNLNFSIWSSSVPSGHPTPSGILSGHATSSSNWDNQTLQFIQMPDWAQNSPMLDHQENGATHLPPEAPAGILKIYRLYQFPQCPKTAS
jgi:hypothetical protein